MNRYFKIHGMDCADEVAVLKSELGPLVGDENLLSFDVLNGRMGVAAPESDLASAKVIEAVGRTGMTAEPWREESAKEESISWWERYGRTLLTVTSGVLNLCGFVAHAVAAGSLVQALGLTENPDAAETPLISKVLFSLSVIAGVWHFLPKAWHSLRRLRPDMNLLMTVAVIGAIGIGEWSEAATVAFLFAVSLALESWSVGRARRAIAALMGLTPPTVRIVSKDGNEQELSPEQVEVGTTFLVRPGERIALDGLVARGSSDVNQASITG
jgi:Cd2+/Zn2+-exporting ATPase